MRFVVPGEQLQIPLTVQHENPSSLSASADLYVGDTQLSGVSVSWTLFTGSARAEFAVTVPANALPGEVYHLEGVVTDGEGNEVPFDLEVGQLDPDVLLFGTVGSIITAQEFSINESPDTPTRLLYNWVVFKSGPAKGQTRRIQAVNTTPVLTFAIEPDLNTPLPVQGDRFIVIPSSKVSLEAAHGLATAANLTTVSNKLGPFTGAGTYSVHGWLLGMATEIAAPDGLTDFLPSESSLQAIAGEQFTEDQRNNLHNMAHGFLTMIEEDPENPGVAIYLASAFSNIDIGLTPEQETILEAIKSKTDTIVAGSVKVISPVGPAGLITLIQGFDWVGVHNASIILEEPYVDAWPDSINDANSQIIYAVKSDGTEEFTGTGSFLAPLADGRRQLGYDILKEELTDWPGRYDYYLGSTFSDGKRIVFAQGQLTLKRGPSI